MERRNRSLRALEELIYIDSLDSYDKANSLINWYNKYLKDSDITNFDLELKNLEWLLELFYKNINFLKEHRIKIKQDIIENAKMQKFLGH